MAALNRARTQLDYLLCSLSDAYTRSVKSHSLLRPPSHKHWAVARSVIEQPILFCWTIRTWYLISLIRQGWAHARHFMCFLIQTSFHSHCSLCSQVSSWRSSSEHVFPVPDLSSLYWYPQYSEKHPNLPDGYFWNILQLVASSRVWKLLSFYSTFSSVLLCSFCHITGGDLWGERRSFCHWKWSRCGGCCPAPAETRRYLCGCCTGGGDGLSAISHHGKCQLDFRIATIIL